MSWVNKKGDFVNLTNIDWKELDINFSNEEIADISKWSGEKILKEKTKTTAFKFFNEDNESKE